jgi:hypothetical protein
LSLLIAVGNALAASTFIFHDGFAHGKLIIFYDGFAHGKPIWNVP